MLGWNFGSDTPNILEMFLGIFLEQWGIKCCRPGQDSGKPVNVVYYPDICPVHLLYLRVGQKLNVND